MKQKELGEKSSYSDHAETCYGGRLVISLTFVSLYMTTIMKIINYSNIQFGLIDEISDINATFRKARQIIRENMNCRIRCHSVILTVITFLKPIHGSAACWYGECQMSFFQRFIVLPVQKDHRERKPEQSCKKILKQD